MTVFRAVFPAVIFLLSGGPAFAQGQPVGPLPPAKEATERPLICQPVPTEGDPDLHYLSGGTIRRPCVWRNPFDPAEVRLWIGEDGGRIRHSRDGGKTWVIQDAPHDAAQMIIDIHFLDDGLTGWATGRGGRVLKTVNGGDDWQHLNPAEPLLEAKNGDPGVFWGIHFLPDNTDLGWVAGLWAFSMTSDGGDEWEDVQIFRDPDDTVPLDPMDFEFYALWMTGTHGGGFKGLVGANWETNLPPDVPAGERLGVVFHTDSTDSRSSLGRRWWITLEKSEAEFNDPWDFDFEDENRGYLVGGSGNGNGSIFRTLNGGLTWSDPEPPHASASHDSYATLYGVADLGGGLAVASGYAGNIWVRDRATGTWIDRFVPGYTAPLMGAGGIVGTDRAWVTGSFGFLRETNDAGMNWTSANHGEYLLRARGVHFIDLANGVLVGQPDQVFRTSDGGCTFKKVYPSGPGFGPKPHLSAVTFSTDRIGIAVGAAGNVVRTTDGGRTWSPDGVSGVASDVHLEDIVHRLRREFWAVGRQGQSAIVLRTEDDGATWNEVVGLPETDGVQLNGISFVTARKAFVVGVKGEEGRAFHYNVNAFPPWSDVSPRPDPDGARRGLLDVDSGLVDGVRSTFACGENGTLLRWNGASFEGVEGVYEFDPGTGIVSVQRQVHDYSAIGIASAIGHVLVGNNAENHDGQSGSEDTATLHLQGYTLRYDGNEWQEIRSSTNKNAQGFSFVTVGDRVVGFMLGGGGPGAITLGTLADSELTIYEPE